MIKLEHTVLPSTKQIQFVIEGMRNPMNSWDKSDSVAMLTKNVKVYVMKIKLGYVLVTTTAH